MSAAIAQLDANPGRVRARLKAMHWNSEEHKASLACVAAMGRGDRRGAHALEAWAEICGLRARAWAEEVEHVEGNQ